MLHELLWQGVLECRHGLPFTATLCLRHHSFRRRLGRPQTRLSPPMVAGIRLTRVCLSDMVADMLPPPGAYLASLRSLSLDTCKVTKSRLFGS